MAQNLYLQAQLVEILAAKAPRQIPPLNSAVLCVLHRVILQGIRRTAGVLRKRPVQLKASKHVPPHHDHVPAHVDNLCDYVAENWSPGLDEDELGHALHLAAYVLWRVNWIHPFRDGNGRTARAAAHLVLWTNSGMELPSGFSLLKAEGPARDRYFEALGLADEADQDSVVDVSDLEDLLFDLVCDELELEEATYSESLSEESADEDAP